MKRNTRKANGEKSVNNNSHNNENLNQNSEYGIQSVIKWKMVKWTSNCVYNIIIITMYNVQCTKQWNGCLWKLDEIE